MRLIFLLLFAPLVAVSQSLTGYDFICKTMEILDPVKYSDEYYVIEETRAVDLKVSFYHNNIVIYDYIEQTSNVMDVTFMQYDLESRADIYVLESPDEPGSAVYVFYESGMVNFCIEWIPEWNRYKNIYRLRNLTYIGNK
jgi:hypothetical protein